MTTGGINATDSQSARQHARGFSALIRIIHCLAAAVCFISVGCARNKPETQLNLNYPQDINTWIEVPVPRDSDRGQWMVWHYAANRSRHEWFVRRTDGSITAELTEPRVWKNRDSIPFSPAAGRFKEPLTFKKVNDGWIVGFNQGEFGAALYWFSPKGFQQYKISDHQVVEFFTLGNNLYAIEGLAHLTSTEGSIIQILRKNAKDHWAALHVLDLPQAPFAVSVASNRTAFITLSDSLVAFQNDGGIVTLLPKARWGSLYPNSSVLSSDEQKLYIGMRQYVAEFDFRSRKTRFLIPDEKFLNKLPENEAISIRNQFKTSEK